MAEPQQPIVQTPENTQQQVTSKTPTTKQQKNPKRVAAGKAIAEKTRIAREAQKKALIEAQSIIAKHAAPVAEPPAAEPPAAEPPAAEPPSETKNVLTTTQWLSIISIVVSLVGVYYKREEIKNAFYKKATPPPRAPPPSPVVAAPTGGINRMY